MEDIKKDLVVEEDSPEAKALEESALTETSQDVVRKEMIEKHGLNETDHSTIIDSLVADKLEERKSLSVAIRQKIKYRTELAEEKKVVDKKLDVKFEPSDIDKLIDSKVSEKLEKKDLDSLEMSDVLKQEVKSYASLNKVSIKEALKSEYVQFQLSKEAEKANIDKASISSKHDKNWSSRDFKNMSPDDFDITTEEGKKGWAEYKSWLKTQ